jgi:hypothetical protein
MPRLSAARSHGNSLLLNVMRKSWSSILLAALVIQIPFEARYTLLGLSNLKWTFIALALVSVPDLIANRKVIFRQRLIQVALLFVLFQWLAAVLAPEFHINALKAAVRFTAGLLLLMISFVIKNSPPESGGVARGAGVVPERKSSVKEPPRLASLDTPPNLRREFVFHYAWVIASAVAAAYAVLSYAGIGVPSLFRNEEFYIGQVQRLSGSFEYPNTAAAYFAMSLPIVWWSPFRFIWRAIIALLLWCAVILTFSKGALAAIPLAVIGAMVLTSLRTIQWKPAAALIAIGIVSYVILLPVNPYLIERLYGPAMRNPLSAEYQTPWNHLQQQPGTNDQVPLHIRNTGATKWRAGGLWRSSIAYRWWSAESETFVQGEPLVTPLPHDVGHDEAVDALARIQTPSRPGKYILVTELFSRNYDWFSRTGVVPSLVQVDVQPGITRSVDTIDLSAMYRRGRRPGFLTAAVSRSQLWTAAVKIFLAHPLLGSGPDNFRLEYGKYIGAVRWDTKVYSNNLFLEILAGSGILGLAAFVWLILRLRWQFTASSIALAIFLLHGLVDVFLMTTPIYFAFWLLLGTRATADLTTT